MSDAPPDGRHTRLALSGRSVALIVATVAIVGALLGITRASARVLGWMGAAASIAALLEPMVNTLAQHVRRGLAVLICVLAVLGTVGGIAFSPSTTSCTRSTCSNASRLSAPTRSKGPTASAPRPARSSSRRARALR